MSKFQEKKVRQTADRKLTILLDLINLLASITIIISLGTWLGSRQERWENGIFSSWNIAQEAKGNQSGVARLALERLLRNGFSLTGLDLDKTYLVAAKLPQANLKNANLQQAHLGSVNLQQAELKNTNLQQANLKNANLQQADLEGANLQQAYLGSAKDLIPKQLKSACFWEEAIYKGQWNEEKKTWEAIKPDNINFIDNLKKHKSSDPKEPIDCSLWSKETTMNYVHN